MASRPTSTAPCRIYAVLKPLSPTMMGEPRVLTPTVDAMAAVPMLMTTEVRTPAMITGNASGRSMRVRIWAARGEAQRFVDVVRYEDDGFARCPVNTRKLVLQRHAGERIE